MNKKITLPAIIIALSLMTFVGYAQNVGIGQIHPASKLDLSGNLTLGGDYSGTGAPTNGAIIEGNVGIGTTLPGQTLEIGKPTGTIRIDGMIAGNSFNTSASSLSNLVFVNNSTGDLSALPNGSSGQVLSLNGSSVPTWSTPNAGSVTSITAGTGLSGGTISSSGTISITATGIGATSYGDANDFTTFTVNAEGQLTVAGTEPLPTSLPPSGTASGDLSSSYPNPTVSAINGVALGSTTATSGNLLIANGTNWVTKAMSGDATISSAGAVTVGGLLGKTISPTTLASTDILEYNGTNWVPTAFPTSLAPSGTASGDLSGTYPGPTVAKIQGIGITSTTPTTAQVLEYNGTNWVPTALPTSLAPSGTASGDLSGSYPSPTVAKIQGIGVTSTTPTTGQVLEYNGTNWTPTTNGAGTVTSIIAGNGLTGGTITSSGTIALPYTEWVGIISQSGSSSSDHPTDSVVFNSTGYSITFARTGTGVYTATLTGTGASFHSANLTVPIISNPISSSGHFASIVYTSKTVLTITTYSIGFSSVTPADSYLSNTPLDIKIY